MIKTWHYNNLPYATESEVNQAVVEMKGRLDNNPTDWAVVKQLTGDAESGWGVPQEGITDAEINALDETQHYSISSVIGGGSEVGLTATETTAKVAEYRTEYAQFFRVDVIGCTYNPTHEDMSGYV
tara:strand:+ start:903 stop:1280 length:378 start_codon:yes stop_codon:yes gene_type:complete